MFKLFKGTKKKLRSKNIYKTKKYNFKKFKKNPAKINHKKSSNQSINGDKKIFNLVRIYLKYIKRLQKRLKKIEKKVFENKLKNF